MRILPCHLQSRKRRQSGSALIEIATAYGILVIVAMLTLKATLNTSASQSWTVKQTMSDAYLTRETAMAQRVPFDDLTSGSSLWAESPSVTTSSVVIGKLPGGTEVNGTLHRTRIADENNLAAAGGSGTSDSNPGATEAWKLQSLLVYEVGKKKYFKSRTTLRIR